MSCSCCGVFSIDHMAEMRIVNQVLKVLTESNAFANPTASVGLTAVNGTATTAMRSDAAPPIDQSITPTWTGNHTHQAVGIEINGGAGLDVLGGGIVQVDTAASANLFPWIDDIRHLEGEVMGAPFWIESNSTGTGFAFEHQHSGAASGGHTDWSSSVGASLATLDNNGVLRTIDGAGSLSQVLTQKNAFADPTASVGLTAVNGTATTAMRSDGAPALDQGIAPTWSALHTFSLQDVHTLGIDLSTSGEIESQVASASPAVFVNAAAGGHTGDLFEVQDAGTWNFRVNSAGNLQLASGKGIFASYGLDESTYPNFFTHFANNFTGAITANKETVHIGGRGLNNNASSNDVYGVRCQQDFSSATASSTIQNVWGGSFVALFSGSANSRAVNAFCTGGQFISRATQTGTGATLRDMIAAYLSCEATGQNITITTQSGVRILTPAAFGTGTTATSAYGIEIKDQRGQAGTNNAAIRVDTQTLGSSATAGNIWCAGGDWNTGHFQLETGHIWATGGDLRFNDGTPASATDYDFQVNATRCEAPNELQIGGNLNHDGTNIGFFGVAPVARAAAYTPTNVVTDRSYDANSTSMNELADVLGTLIADLQGYGLLQ